MTAIETQRITPALRKSSSLIIHSKYSLAHNILTSTLNFFQNFCQFLSAVLWSFGRWTPGVCFFSCRDSSKGLLTSFECLVFLLYLWASINRIQVFRLPTTCKISATVAVLAAVFAWRASSICFLTIDVNLIVLWSVLTWSVPGSSEEIGGVSKPIRNGEIFWLNRVELQWGWVRILLCHADWEWCIPMLRESSARVYATSWHKWWLSERTVNKNSHWLKVIKTSVKCLLLTPCLMIIAVIKIGPFGTNPD